ncbi:hypothetical protein AVEN_166100-1 [Araneus ventricosus]|uniref:Mariner Mos1 transposase n=1 Tax=Araneus ventricosus TaxID=182803 RepID=A0A4Y2FS04_ARAVE|nr:hypothetical protein AVEN_166100-1 [Araneus ventricosus]
MLIVFWDAKSVILIDFITSGTIKSARYCDILTKLKSAIRRHRAGFLIRGVLFLENNARPHSATDAKEHIRHLGRERLDHPSYKSDLLPFSCNEVSTIGTSLPKQ